MPVANDQLLTINQRRIVGTALAALGLLVLASVVVLLVLLMRSFVEEFGIVIWPIAVAGILALILQPLVRFLHLKVGMPRLWSVVLLYVLAVVSILLLGYFLLPVLARQILEFIQTIPQLLQNFLNYLDDAMPQFANWARERLRNVEMEDATQELRAVAGPAASSFVGMLARVQAWVVAVGAQVTAAGIVPIYLFFFLLVERDPTRELSRHLDFLREDWRRDAIFLVRVFVHNIEAFFRGQILIALIMGALYAIGFSIIGLNFGILVGLALGFLNIVPYLGSIIGLATVLPMAYLQPGDGGLVMVGGSIVVFTVVQMIEGWILTPKIMGNMTGLHPVVVIIGIFFWAVALDGILGMILAIPLTAFLIVAWRFVFRRYLSHLLTVAAENHEEEVAEREQEHTQPDNQPAS